MAPLHAFLLNLDAERELAGEPADPFAALEHRPELVRAAGALLRGSLLVTREALRARAAKGLEGRAWCPTPRALAALAEAGATVPPAPPVEVLRRVNDRRFSIEHASDGAYEAWFSDSVEGAEARLGLPSPTGRYLLKQPLGFAGRGRLVTATFDDRTARFVRGSVARFGGVALEPLYDRTLDVAIHGFVPRAGGAVIGAPTVTTVSLGGTFIESRRARSDELDGAEAAALHAEAAHVATVLRAAGYFGPFGLDGFRFMREGREFLAPRCEINARYTMGWAVGMGDARPDLDM